MIRISTIIVNDRIKIEGKLNLTVEYSPTDPRILSIEGSLVSSAGYLTPIYSLENERYRIDGITVLKELYDGEEDEIGYSFMARSYSIADRLTEVKTVDE